MFLTGFTGLTGLPGFARALRAGEMEKEEGRIKLIRERLVSSDITLHQAALQEGGVIRMVAVRESLRLWFRGIMLGCCWIVVAFVLSENLSYLRDVLGDYFQSYCQRHFYGVLSFIVFVDYRLMAIIVPPIFFIGEAWENRNRYLGIVNRCGRYICIGLFFIGLFTSCDALLNK